MIYHIKDYSAFLGELHYLLPFFYDINVKNLDVSASDVVKVSILFSSVDFPQSHIR